MRCRNLDGKKQEVEEERVTEILARLEQLYPEANCALLHQDPYQLLVATVLSAQCTDVRVNLVTPTLFKSYPNLQSLAQADHEELQEIIYSTGFFRNKARNLISTAKRLVEDFDSEVPNTMEDLLKLSGVARKTANVVLGTAFGISSGVVVDTHVKRLSRRLGLTHEDSPVKIEKDLMVKIPESRWIDFSHQLIHHGRKICKSQRPQCERCALADLCPYYQH